MPILNLGRVGFVNKGVWLISTAYKINDTVTYLGGTYACLIANTGQTPILGGTVYWQEWIANDVVHKSGDESIDGIKTFTSSPIIPNATAPGQATNKGQLDLKAPLVSPAFTGTPTINGGRALDDDTVAYNNDTTSFIANTLASGAIIEIGSNANGSYVKFADGTLICEKYDASITVTTSTLRATPIYSSAPYTWTFPHSFIAMPSVFDGFAWNGTGGYTWSSVVGTSAGTNCSLMCWSYSSGSVGKLMVSAIGRWK